jgi:hypothetical protein
MPCARAHVHKGVAISTGHDPLNAPRVRRLSFLPRYPARVLAALNRSDTVFTAFQPATRMRSGACMLDTYMRIAPTHILLDRILSQATSAALRSDAANKARRRPPRDPASRHPCRQAASFLPCASRPPDACRLCLARPRQCLGQGSRDRPAFVTTRSGFDTMASPGRRRRRNQGGRQHCWRCNIRRCPHPWPKAGHTVFYDC